MRNETENTAKIRLSGVELLKIFAIFLICVSHVVQTSEKILDYNTISATIVILKLLKHCGQIGNIIFIISTAYYLVNSTEAKKHKLIKILLDSMIISTTIFIVFLINGHAFTAIETVKQIFPDIFLNLWFIPAYVILYFVHPLLNKICNKISKKLQLILIITFTAIYVSLGTILNFYFVSNTAGCIIVYLIVNYVKRYNLEFCDNKQKNIVGSIIFYFIFILLTTAINLIFTSQDYFNAAISIFLVPANLCLFNAVKLTKFKNRTINFISSCSLFFYCLHENILIRTYIRPKNLKFFFGQINNTYILGTIIYSISIFALYLTIAVIYKLTISKFTEYISKKMSDLFDKIMLKFKKPKDEIKQA